MISTRVWASSRVAVMTPAELKLANIKRFERLLGEGPDAARRETIERVLAEERAKPLSDYPDTGKPAVRPAGNG